jgi:DNA-directed RNA polymerase specialized sigma24 family protein
MGENAPPNHAIPCGLARIASSEIPFPPTDWSMILDAAGRRPDSEVARRAFERLCCEYRDSIVRWMGLQRLTAEDAEDAAHDFLHRWLERENPLLGFERGERRFRDFLRVCLRRFLIDWQEARVAKRRGGGAVHLPLPPDELMANPQDPLEDIDFALAAQIHERVVARLQSEWDGLVTREAFHRIRTVALNPQENVSYASLARELAISVGTLKSWIFRLRRRYHDIFREAVRSQTDPSELDDELVYLHGLVLGTRA